LLAAQFALADATLPGRDASLSKRLVWAHSMECFPIELKWYLPYHPEGYPALYPLRQEKGLEARTHEGSIENDLHDAQTAGVDGFAVDIFTGNADAYMAAADKTPGFLIAPCLDLSILDAKDKEAAAISTIANHCNLANKHSSAAKVGDAYLIFTYGTDQMPPSAWHRVRQELERRGCRTYFMAAVGYTGNMAVLSDFPAKELSSYAPEFESFYLFGSAGPHWQQLVTLMADLKKPFGGGVMPGYFRIGGGYQDAQATELYRKYWNQHLNAPIPWACITTWNDLAESTGILPNSDFNFTRVDLTRWYSAKFKGIATGWTEPRLYITTSKTAYVGQTVRAEALVLNPTERPAEVDIQLYDGDGKRFGAVSRATVGPREAGAATLLPALTSSPAGHFLRARASLVQNSRKVSQVKSAPILVPDPFAQPGYSGQLYYSIPAEKSLAGPVGLAFAHSAKDGYSGTATIQPPVGVAVKMAEVLHNTELTKNFFTAEPYSVNAPSPCIDGDSIADTPWGFYVARVTDVNLRVGYSDPVYLAPPGDLALREHYSFTEGSGTILSDTSSFHRQAQIVAASWQSPGVDDKGACLSFDGQRSRVNMALSQTPVGSMSIEAAVRPRAYGGMIFCDSGGFWIATAPDGKVTTVRLSTHSWATLTGSAVIPLGQWSRVKVNWDGHKLSLFVNGKPDGVLALDSKFTSFRRALGCNPFGSGSAYFDGDIGDFTIRLIQ